MENKSFCVLPWMHVDSRSNGDVRLCCKSSRLIKKSNGTVYNLGVDSIDEIYNSDAFIDVRRKMIAGEKVPGCDFCYRQEESSNSSSRLLFNKQFPVHKIVDESIKNDYKITPTIRYLHFRPGNLCNLKCRSCNPTNSIQIDKEVAELPNSNIISRIYPVVKSDSNIWYTTETFFDSLSKMKNDLKVVCVTGGEPTIIEETYRLMQMLIDEGAKDKIVFVFNTNMTNVQDRFLTYANQFKQVIINCSIEGIGNVQEYLRYPSKWATVDKNLRKLINKTTNSVIRIVPVVQNVNLEFMSELFEHIENINKQAKKRVVEIVPFLLDQPDIMDIQYLPLEYKKQCWDKLEKWLTTVEYQDEIFQETMKQIRYMCYKDVDGEVKLAEFAELTKILDVHRGQSLQTVNPNLYKILYEK